MTYEGMFKAIKIKPEKIAEVRYVVAKMKANQKKYQNVANHFNGMPWWYVGVIHQMESGGKFTRHLHNGDSLMYKTVNVPKGRPKGEPPFTWEQSAIDALQYTGHDKVTDWSIENCLNLLERYNGLGYRKRGVPSPYLWSYSQWYNKGKYVADGKYDANAVSKQPGVACIISEL